MCVLLHSFGEAEVTVIVSGCSDAQNPFANVPGSMFASHSSSEASATINNTLAST
jgi:hypothetical protein